ncbi:MAG: HD domain-containing protein [Planctomycetales bacterium]|nr:HD domain-containing protein [Planctomycetales bacterium]
MPAKTVPMTLLAEMAPGDVGDMFLLMTVKEAATTRDGRPYFKVAFRDAGREVSFPIWEDAAFSSACRDEWEVGAFYKVRARYVETNFGPQLEIEKIRPVQPADERDGFDPLMCTPQSRFDPEEMVAELVGLVRRHVTDAALCRLVLELLEDHREAFLKFPAASHNHHAYAAGLLEHTLSVTRSCVFLAQKYDDYYDDLQPPLRKDLVVAGAVLHDIGKLQEYDLKPQGAEYSVAGNLIGHVLLGRDMVRQSPAAADVDPDTLLRLEHIIVSHQRLPEWGAPKPPLTPEAMIIHFADDLDAKYHMLVTAIRDDVTEGPLTSNRNTLRQRFYRGHR